MNKMKKFFNFVFIGCLVLIINSIIIVNYCNGNGSKMESNENLISDYNLYDTDKIIIETRKDIGFKPYQHIIITNQDTINNMIDEIKNSNYGGGILLAYDYIVSFWKGDKELLVVGLSINLDDSKYSFIRHRTEDYTHNYYISRILHDFFVSTLNLDKEVKTEGDDLK